MPSRARDVLIAHFVLYGVSQSGKTKKDFEKQWLTIAAIKDAIWISRNFLQLSKLHAASQGHSHQEQSSVPTRRREPELHGKGLGSDDQALRERQLGRSENAGDRCWAPWQDPGPRCLGVQPFCLFFLSVLHTLKFFKTASSQIPNIPDYFEVGYVDGVPILHYDSKSRKAKPKQDWMKKITADDPHYWERLTQIGIGGEQVYKVNIETAKERFNQTGGVHMFQRMLGCEWDDETDEVVGWRHYSYNGEDFISLEVKTMRWIAAHPQAFVTKLKWDSYELWNLNQKHYFTEICPSDLKKHLTNGRDFLMRTELPTVSLLQKTPSSPVTCHATGFYPSVAALFWRKDGEELHEDAETGETLRNHDGTFQMTADLKAEVTDEAEGRYECVFQLSGVADDIVVKLERRSIRSNAPIRGDRRSD
ncbi:major histocompatibility complex class I-related gene protein-like, partial [Phyllopteryx taeniolatus]|uniref:major histocompatibility complex class I-related gene protein-like n=1 Tax=Phyllopteryx taeniolatus TaxID=161469 RepID=UPI002AD563EE